MNKSALLSAALAIALSGCSGYNFRDAINVGGWMDKPAQQNLDPIQLNQQAETAYRSGDKASAAQLWEQAAQAGNADAQYKLFVLYRKGDGVAQNEQQSLHWLNESAKQGYKPAVYALSGVYLTQGNIKQAVPMLQNLANADYPPALFHLGVMLVRGDGVQQNKKLGLQLIQRSAAAGFPPAQKALQK